MENLSNIKYTPKFNNFTNYNKLFKKMLLFYLFYQVFLKLTGCKSLTYYKQALFRNCMLLDHYSLYILD